MRDDKVCSEKENEKSSESTRQWLLSYFYVFFVLEPQVTYYANKDMAGAPALVV